nr:MAG TPA: hypothetical protein [Caudoviricetes sp.]
MDHVKGVYQCVWQVFWAACGKAGNLFFLFLLLFRCILKLSGRR